MGVTRLNKNKLESRKLFLILVSALLFIGCRKDPVHLDLPEPIDSCCVEPWCDEFPEPPEIGFAFTSSGVQYKSPCFNPMNGDEFVYLRYQEGSFLPELVKYNMSSNQEQVLANSVNIISQPQWGRLGWITFTTIDWNVWKIFQDGSQLTQLTFGEQDQYPLFNFSGDKITYYRGKLYSNFELENNPDLILNYKMLVIDLDGNVLDSVLVPNIHNQYMEHFMYQTWQTAGRDENDRTYFMEGTGNIQGIYQLIGDTIFMLKEWFGHQGILDIKACDGHVYFSRHREGLFELNNSSGNQTLVRWGCDTRFYNVLSISPDNEKMLVQKVISTPYAEGQAIDEQHEIWLLELNGCGGQKILGD